MYNNNANKWDGEIEVKTIDICNMCGSGGNGAAIQHPVMHLYNGMKIADVGCWVNAGQVWVGVTRIDSLWAFDAIKRLPNTLDDPFKSVEDYMNRLKKPFVLTRHTPVPDPYFRR